MKKGDIVTGIVESIDFPNKCHVRVNEEETVTVKNAILGQKVSVRVLKKKSGKATGNVLEVLAPGPGETRTPCKDFGLCGGCVYNPVDYQEELSLKESQIKKLLDGVIRTPYEFEPILGSPISSGYRNKMEFSFGDLEKDGPMTLGMHRRGSFYDIVTVDSCDMVHSDYHQILSTVLSWAKETGLSYMRKNTHEGFFRHLLVRRAVKTKEILVDLVTTTQAECDFKPLVEALLALPLEGRICGILRTKNDSLADAVINEGTELLYGEEFFYEEILGLKFKITPFSFFQTNSLGAEVLYTKVREYIGAIDGQKVFDLYSGTGTIAQMISPAAKQVIGVEIIEEAVEAAKINAKLNGIENCEFIANDVLKALDEIEEKPDMIILDPPRDGIHPKALPKILSYGVDRIVYISCKPTSLVRDLEVIQDQGYRVVKACAVDMFPRTANCESCVLLERVSN